MKHEAPAAHVPDLLLERLRLRELPAAEEAALRSRIEREPELRQRMAALEASDAALAASGDLQALATRVSAAARTPAPQHRRADRLVGWAAAAAAVAATAMMVPGALARRPAGGTAEPAASVSETRVKGLQPALTVFRKTKSGSEPLPDGSAAREGDLLRLAYDAAGRAYGAILSVDGRGAVTLHLPRQGGQAARLSAGGAVLLDEAYQLDDAPREERFVFVTSDAPFPVAPVIAAARLSAAGGSAHPLALPPALHQFTLTLQKGPSR